MSDVRSIAFLQGRRAGIDSLSPGVNPYPEGSADALEWMRGLQSAQESVNRYANAKPAREWWEDRADFDMTTSGSRLRAGQ